MRQQGDEYGALQVRLSHAVDDARALPAGSVAPDGRALILTYARQILDAVDAAALKPKEKSDA